MRLSAYSLIFNKERESGYVVAVVDNVGKGAEARYWLNDFLHVRRRKDEYTNTQNFMTLAKNFVIQELPKELGTTKVNQFDLLK
ncbi:nucleoid-associated protein [Treponema sp. OMZ 803]|uniref:nucleoid-associated protein n=1 Tax=Treponema sp. OMZ 803 TaxID=120682 RepID=UPI00220F07BE|nr:nucleoid-associated protein [Treponema sp. OMZ 803]